MEELLQEKKTSTRKWKIVSWQEGKQDYKSVLLVLMLIAVMVWRFITLDADSAGNSLILDSVANKLYFGRIFVVLAGVALLFNLWYLFHNLVFRVETHYAPLTEIGKVFWGFFSVSFFFAAVSCGIFGGKLLWLSLCLLIFFSIETLYFSLLYLLGLLAYVAKRILDKIKEME